MIAVVAPRLRVSSQPRKHWRVERRWSEYFPAGGVEMGDSDAGHLDG